MSADDEDRAQEAKKLPTGRVARTARVGGLVAGQGVRWAGTRAANRVRTPERAAAAENVRIAATVNELVEQLGRMRGAAMKVGQMLSMIEFDGLDEEQKDTLQRTLATLRDDVPPVPFKQLEKLIKAELGAPIGTVFAEFNEEAFAAASIGQVHRARTREGDDVVVKLQYPGIAEAVETDLRNAMLLVPLLKRLAPGVDVRALALEMRERVSEELDYELEAQNQRRIERLTRGHPFISVPKVHTDLSTRRILVSDYVEGMRFEEVRRADEAERDRYGEIVFRFFFGLLYRDRIALGDPHPGNYLLRPDGTVGFLDFGLLRDVSATRVTAEGKIALAVRDKDADGLKQALMGGAYLPAERADAVDGEFALRLMRHATRWYAVPGERRFGSGRRQAEDSATADANATANSNGNGRPDPAQREAIKGQLQQFTLPAESILIRRMHAVVVTVLQQLRAKADWGAIASEYLHGDPPATPMGEAESAYLSRRGR